MAFAPARRAMRKRRTTEITIEREEVFVIRTSGARGRAWCEACGAEVEFVSPEAAAVVARTTARTVYRLVEAGRLHFAETADGLLLVCLRSIT